MSMVAGLELPSALRHIAVSVGRFSRAALVAAQKGSEHTQQLEKDSMKRIEDCNIHANERFAVKERVWLLIHEPHIGPIEGEKMAAPSLGLITVPGA
jgi:hypothetical protein